MKNKLLLPALGVWLTTLVAAYYIGSFQTDSEVSSNDTIALDSSSSDQSHFGRHTTEDYLTNSTSRITSRKSLRGASAGTTPTGSIKGISQLSDPLERSRQILSLIDSMNPEDFALVVADFRALGMTRQRMSDYNMLLHAWGKVDPLAAIKFAQSKAKSEYAIKEVLASWATNNPNAALAWARENHDSDKANPYLVGIIRGLANANSTLATQVLQELPYSEERGEALRSLAPYIALLGIDEAQQWLNEIEDPKLVSGASAYLANQFSKQDPTIAAEWVSRIADDEARARALGEVVDHWTDQDPSAAKAWIATLPHQDQIKAGPDFVSAYAKQDAHAAADWLDANSNASNYQDLLRKFSEGATRSDPVLALNYGNELNDESSRSRTVGRALWTLYKQDRAEAENWIQNNDVPERVQRHVNKMMDKK
ncbi:MAG: hypothetical protein ABGY95_01535 [Rubritalea sp.]|uniref:hypothetical protein n=1 Tax=Rubritalea sp. TaxID=2109375 RepID=UPI003242BFAC